MPKPSFSGAGAGAISGGATGFSVGGPIGGLVGAGLGGLAGLFGGGAGQKKEKFKQVSTKTPQQQALMELIQEGLESGEGPFGDLFGKFDEGAFQKGVTNPALKNFQENILPQLQEKFNAGGQYGGSGMRNAQMKAGVDLQDRLAQLMYQAQQGQNQNRLQGLSGLINSQNVQNIRQEPQQGIGGMALQGLAPGIIGGISEGIGGRFKNSILGNQNPIAPQPNQVQVG